MFKNIKKAGTSKLILILVLLFIMSGCQATLSVEIPASRVTFHVYDVHHHRYGDYIWVSGCFINEGPNIVTGIRNVRIDLYSSYDYYRSRYTGFIGTYYPYSYFRYDHRELASIDLMPGQRLRWEFRIPYVRHADHAVVRFDHRIATRIR